MNYQVIDTNVLIGANGIETHADRQCQRDCARRLHDTQINNTLVLDTRWDILKEYQRRLSRCAPNSPGNLFFIWAARSSPGLLVILTPDDAQSYTEFPSSASLRDFDRDDRKFVAAASAALHSGYPTRIVNALDSDYEEHQTALQEVGIIVDELCPQHLSPSPRNDKRHADA